MHVYTYILTDFPGRNVSRTRGTVSMGCLRLVGSLKLQGSLAKESYKRVDILQKGPMILRSLQIVATPYQRFIELSRESAISATRTCLRCMVSWKFSKPSSIVIPYSKLSSELTFENIWQCGDKDALEVDGLIFLEAPELVGSPHDKHAHKRKAPSSPATTPLRPYKIAAASPQRLTRVRTEREREKERERESEREGERER